MASRKTVTHLVFCASFLTCLVFSAPQQPPSQPGPFGGPFLAGNASATLSTGSAKNASMCQVQNNGLGPVDGGPPNPDVYSTRCSCSDLFSAHAATMTSTFMNRIGPVTETLTTFTDTSFQPPDDCCIKCWISAKDVQIIYWPVATSAPSRGNATSGSNRWNASSSVSVSATITPAPTPYTLVQDGFTFTSPSVYVAYHDLQAYAVCPSFGNTYPRGRTYNTTIAYMPNQLSTSICTTGAQGIQPVGYGHFAAINYTEYQFSTSAWSQCAKEIEAGSGGSASIEGPFYSIPHDVSLIDPAWQTCSAVFNGVFDPPRQLEPAPALVTGQDTGPLVGSPTPAPAATALKPAPLLVPPTSVNPNPTSVAPTNSIDNANQPSNLPPVNNPPAKNDPQDGANGNNGNSAIISAPAPNGPAAPTLTSNPVIMHAVNPPPPITAAGVTISRVTPSPGVTNDNGAGTDTSGGVVIGGSTYANGVSTTLPGPNGAPISVGSDHILVAGSSYTLPPVANPSPVLIGGNPISRAPNGGLAIGTATINPDAGPTTAYGHAVAIDHSSAIIDGSTYALPPASPTQGSSPAITLSNGQVLAAGGPPAVVSGTTVALAPNGASVVINGQSFAIPTTNPSADRPILTIGGQTFAAAASGFTVDGQTVKPGAAPITINGTPLSLGPSGQVVVGSSTTLLPTITAGPVTSPLTIGGQTFLAASGGFAIGSQTVAPGGSPVTVDGTVISLGPSGKLVIGSQTTVLPSNGSGVEETVGGVVIDAPSATGSSLQGTSGVLQGFKGSGERLKIASWHLILAALAGIYTI